MSEQDFLNQVRAALDDSAARLDAATVSRLNRARQRALDQGLARRTRWVWPTLALATAASLTLALGLLLHTPEVAAPLPPTAATESLDFELLAGSEDLELIENLEFYAWLEQQYLDG